MNQVAGRPLFQLFQRPATVLEDLVIDDFDLTGRCEGCDKARNAVHDQPRLALAFAQSLLAAFQVVDVDEQVIPADDVSVGVAKRKSARLKPAVNAIESSSAYFPL